ncbi:hypothetical protein DUI87_00168 [Hirundo rustica rustica]|uniref:Ig-like domain-containing protein n=1 Tax=Hirundo rustica rustica TaxID=333673 RepID=A0A3M0LCS5_HIRRU|nr:hypothetical protein DUI87_00168 [Hirundo rustica rustica]
MLLPRCLVLLASLIPPALGSWGVSYPESLKASGGSCLVVPCTFSYPADAATADGIVAIWYKDYEGQRTLVFHSATPQDVDPQDLEPPSVTGSPEQTEGQKATLECSTPYVCPAGDIALHWEGYDPRVSEVSDRVRLDTGGVGRQVNLTSSFSWEDHSKKLLCQVSDGSKRAGAEVVLRVRHAPKDTRASLSPSTGNIGVGDAVTLSCRVGSSHPPVSEYRWYKDGEAVGTGRELALRGVRREDHGSYHCQAQNALGTGASPPVTLRVFCERRQAAEIWASPAAEVLEGTATTLSCEVPGREGHPEELTYTWYKNGAWLKEGPAHALLFPAVAAADAGYYSCQVTNSQGSDTAPAISPQRDVAAKAMPWTPTHPDLSILSHPTDPPRIPRLTLFQETQGGRLVVVLCTVDSHPPASLAIDRDGAVLAASGAEAALLRRLGVTASRNSLRLEIRDAGPRDSGKYGCTASNVHGNASAAKALVTRGLLIQPSAEVTEGTAVTLTCVGTGGEAQKPLYAWYRNGRRLQESSSPTLEFPSVRGDDAGAFQCQVRSGNGSDASEAVPLRVFHPPRQPVLSSFLQSQGGRLGIIQCSVESDPESSLTLRRGDDVIACTQGCPQATSPRVHASRSYNSLKVEIRDVAVEDEGVYTCQAGNSQGSASATVDFKADTANVTVSPSRRVLEGDNATLTCHLSSVSAAVPNVTWYHNGQQCSVASNPPAQLALLRDQELVATGAGGSSPRVSVSAVPNSLRLEIREVTPADDGSYRCTATNEHGSAERRLYLRVQGRGPGGLHGAVTACVPATAQRHRAATNALRVRLRPLQLQDQGEYRCVATNAHGSASAAGNFSGGEVLSYTWYRNQVWLGTGSSQNLTFPGVAASDAGSYQCSVRTPARNHSATPATLNVLSHPAPGGTPLASSPPGGGDTPRQSIRVSPSPNALRLEFRETSEEDEGEYECQARSALGVTRASLTLRVQDAPREPSFAALVETRGGTQAVLLCSADAVPPAPDIAVSRGQGHPPLATTRGRSDPRFEVRATPTSLRVGMAGLEPGDHGLYLCSANNSRGSASASRGWEVPDPPRAVSVSTFLENQSGRGPSCCARPRATRPPGWPCTTAATSFPPSCPPLSTPGLRAVPSHNALRLELVALGTASGGRYVCVATNPLGNATASADLDVPPFGVPLALTPPLSPTALGHLRAYRVLSWLLVAAVAVAIVALLAVKVWPR